MSNSCYSGAEGRQSLYELSYAASANELIVFVHGFMGFKDWGAWHLVQAAFVAAGFDFCRFNLSHNGTTPTNPLEFTALEAFSQNTYSKEVADVHLLIAHLENTHRSWDRIHLIGHSRGGGSALLASKFWPYQSALGEVITWAGICDIGRRFPTGAALQEWEKTGVRTVLNGRTNQELPQSILLYTDYQKHAADLAILEAARQIGKRLHIFHGDKDLSVPLSEAYELAKASGTKVGVIAGADHVFGAVHPWEKPTLPPLLLELVEKSVRCLNDSKP
ncbi:MAG: hypothetical protein RLZZ301_1189 [Bacteroidota bacterium]|jgi:pimeloyl-ACP methyl ester carboxylesterase